MAFGIMYPAMSPTLPVPSSLRKNVMALDVDPPAIATANLASEPAAVTTSRLDAVLAVLARMFGTDLRSLAAFRMVIGLIVLFDILGRWSDVAIHYSDQGL